MTTMDTLGDNRPPPSRPPRFSIGSIPWYRNIKVLRVIAQIVFAILFIGSLIGIFNNLVVNLEASNLRLDFQVYRRTFGTAITEGLSLTEQWMWIRDVGGIEQGVWIGWISLLAIASVIAYRQYRRDRVRPVPLAMIALLLLMLVVYPPGQFAEWLSETFQAYLYPSSMTRAFITGILNTLRVVALSLVACTILGIFAGIGLLSSNFLVRSVSKVYVEIFRNTPLLIQLLFIYRTLSLLLPFPRESIFSPSQIGPITLENNLYALNARGFYYVALVPTDTSWILYTGFVLGLVVAWLVRRQRLKRQELTGEPAQSWRFILPIIIGFTLVSWLISGVPFTLDYPELRGPNIVGGAQMSLGFFSLFLGLTLYTAAFIAEIVRAGIQSVPYGQIEAARSQGFTGGQVLNLVVLPQALRLIIPPLGNQYVNLGKNSSLGIVVNYADTYRIAQIANNESGQAVPFFVGLMVIYLSLSLALSVMTNLVNRTTQVKTR